MVVKSAFIDVLVKNYNDDPAFAKYVNLRLRRTFADSNDLKTYLITLSYGGDIADILLNRYEDIREVPAWKLEKDVYG